MSAEAPADCKARRNRKTAWNFSGVVASDNTDETSREERGALKALLLVVMLMPSVARARPPAPDDVRLPLHALESIRKLARDDAAYHHPWTGKAPGSDESAEAWSPLFGVATLDAYELAGLALSERASDETFIELHNFMQRSVDDPSLANSAPVKIRAPGRTIVCCEAPWDPAVIQHIVRREQGRLQRCYEHGLRVSSRLSGRVVVDFIIQRDGAVSQVSDGGSDLPNAMVTTCILQVFESLWFPASALGAARVRYPLSLRPAEKTNQR